MFCCVNCFKDHEIKEIIEIKNMVGKCDFCGSENVYVYDIDKDNTLSDMFSGLLDVYTPLESLPTDFPKDYTGFLKDVLYRDWHIFNIESESIYKLMASIFASRHEEQPELFDGLVGILQIGNKDYLEENAILKNYHWNDFVETIKRKNRFHSNFINTNVLDIFLPCAKRSYKKGEMFYRARMCPSAEGYQCKDMGAPPHEKAKAGRVNPDGISVLYLSKSNKTTIYEIRAGIYDYVTIGEFELQEDIEVIDLAGINNISPFIGVDYGFDFTQYAINIRHLEMIEQEIAKPLRNDNVLDYLPTQYVSEYIKSKGYKGIKYRSTMDKDGVNIAIFDQGLFKCVSTKVYDVNGIEYSYKEIV